MTTPERSNAQWLEELTGADERRKAAALRELHRYLRAGLGRAFGDQLTEEDLDDHTQEAVIQALDRIETFKERSRFTTWAMAVGVRSTSSALRRRSYTGPSWEEITRNRPQAAVSSVTGPDRTVERNDLIAALDRSIRDELTERQRTVVLALLAGVPIAEVADRLETSPNNVYKVGFDARKALRHALNEAGFTSEDILEELANWS